MTQRTPQEATQKSTQQTARVTLGEQGEQVAVDYLESLGWRVLDRNWRCPIGELDVVAYDAASEQIVFVEVKTRATAFFGRPVEAVKPAKLRRLYRLGAAWAAAQHTRLQVIRVDLVGVVIAEGHVDDVEHLREVTP
ncbi:YraN family protein [Calidifontibacter terrae]